MKNACTLIALAFALSACGDKAAESTEQPEEPAAPPAAAQVAEAGDTEEAPIPDADLPVAADFEEQAEADITESNYEAELDSLAAELEEGE